MNYGVAIFFTDYSIGPLEMGVALEERGFESLWAPEHSHIPLSRKSPYPQGGELPKKYYDVMDPFVTLSAAAAATKTLKLGTGICLVVQRDPIQTAKSVASLDQISKGRFLFGIGAGWNEDEMANHGTTDFKGRFKLMEERVRAMREIWSKSKPEFSGTHVKFGPMMSWPKPLQKPLPVIVGGMYPFGARRAIAFGDGWMPHAARPAYGASDILEHLPAFRDMARAAGRDPSALPITTFGTPAEPDTLQRYRDAGVSRVVFSIASEDHDKTRATLDKLSAAVRAAG
jgi:probable F420-dependent oxidoreductase